MPLTLKIVSKQRHILGADSVRVFSVHGGSIGRAPDNDWVLPDPDRYISGRHAAIDYRDGAYYLRDTSTNGVFVNRSDQPVGKGAPLRLYDGDELRMGDYVFQAHIVNVSPGGSDDSGEEVAGQPGLRIRRKEEDPSALSLKLLGDRAEAAAGSANQEQDAAPPEIIEGDEFAATVRLTDEEVDTRLPIDHKKVAELRLENSARLKIDDGLSFEAPPDAPKERFEGAGRRDFNEAIRLLMEAAGLDSTSLPKGEEEEIVAAIGRMLRSATDGLQALLRQRTLTKGQFRIGQTGMRPIANNPLKLMTNTQEALEQMFYESSDAYLGPLDSFEEAFRDLRNHQAATVKALQIACRELLDQLDPERLEDRFQHAGKPSGLLSGSPKARYWELYRDAYQSIAGFSDDNFASVIGAKFADAYDREIEQALSRHAKKNLS